MKYLLPLFFFALLILSPLAKAADAPYKPVNTKAISDAVRAYNKNKSNLEWLPWASAPADIKEFVLNKDPTLPRVLNYTNDVDVAVRDFDLDGKNDVILSFWKHYSCSNDGCPFAIYYGDPKKTMSDEFIAKEFNVTRRKVTVDGKPRDFESEDITKETPVNFNFVPSGMAERLVDQYWRADPDNAGFLKSSGGVPPFAATVMDLNGDGSAEILVSDTDEEIGDCNPDGITCALQIYTYTGKRLVPLGKMRAAQVKVDVARSLGYHDILAQQEDKSFMRYRWNGVSYAPFKE